jgi:hypothetical protein
MEEKKREPGREPSGGEVALGARGPPPPAPVGARLMGRGARVEVMSALISLAWWSSPVASPLDGYAGARRRLA